MSWAKVKLSENVPGLSRLGRADIYFMRKSRKVSIEYSEPTDTSFK
jgi:hypothetical protein